MNTAPAKAWPLARRAAAMARSARATAQVRPQGSSALPIVSTGLVDTFMAGRHLVAPGDLFQAPVFAQARRDGRPLPGVHARPGTGLMASPSAVPLRLARMAGLLGLPRCVAAPG